MTRPDLSTPDALAQAAAEAAQNKGDEMKVEVTAYLKIRVSLKVQIEAASLDDAIAEVEQRLNDQEYGPEIAEAIKYLGDVEVDDLDADEMPTPTEATP